MIIIIMMILLIITSIKAFFHYHNSINYKILTDKHIKTGDFKRIQSEGDPKSKKLIQKDEDFL